MEYLKSITPTFESVLEVGCGFGRITRLVLSNYPNTKRYKAVDLSPDQVSNAEEYVKSGIDRSTLAHIDLTFAISDIKSLQMNLKYDLVLASEVLLHILPSEIKEIMIKLVELSNCHIINIDYYSEKLNQLAPHNFLHQYEKIYSEIPHIAKVQRVPIRKTGLFGFDTTQSIFHAIKEVRPTSS
ncbi:MAG TPA: class I SAM-dependent methyltransferase [Nitrososphaeraceae archaeon]